MNIFFTFPLKRFRASTYSNFVTVKTSRNLFKNVAQSLQNSHAISSKTSRNLFKNVTQSLQKCYAISSKMPRNLFKNVTQSLQKRHAISSKMSCNLFKNVTQSLQKCLDRLRLSVSVLGPSTVYSTVCIVLVQTFKENFIISCSFETYTVL